MAQSEPAGGEGLVSGAELSLERIYVRDASFESPRAPEVFREQWKPNVQLEINTRANNLGEERFEVILTATMSAKSEAGNTLLIVEVQQAGVFRIRGLSDDNLRRVLATQCPAILFPYIREAVDSMMTRGGFPAVHLAPVNFDAMFEEALRQRGTPPAVQH
jgi:preprotein translocase subunit SecB